MSEQHRARTWILGTAVALAATQGLMPALGQGAGGTEPYVSKEEYQRLQKEHEQLMREFRDLKAQVQGALPAKAAAPAAGATADASGDGAVKSGDAFTLSRYVFPGSSRFNLSGYGSAGFEALRHSDAAFNAQFNPLFLWKINDKLVFEGELELELEDGETATKLEQAHLSYLANDWVTFDAGKFLNPMNSFVERYHMPWVNRLPDKPLAVYDGLLPETYVGAQLRGGVPVGSTRLNYSAFVANAPKLVTGIGPDDEAESLGTLEWDNFGNEGGKVAVGGHVGFLPVAELEIGYGLHYSGLSGSDDQVLLQSVDLNYVRDSEALKGLLRLNAQWVWSHLGEGTYDNDGTDVVFKNNRDGGYIQLAYRPTRFGPDFLRRMEGVVRFDHLNQDKTPVGYDESRYTFGVNYWLTPKTVFKVAYQLDDKSHGEQDNSGVLVQFATGF